MGAPWRFRSMVDAGLAARYRAEGWWADTTISDHVARHAAERPDHAALVADAGTLTWAGYDRAATALAGALVAAGFEPGERIGVLLPDSATVHVAFVACERAGLTVVGVGARAGRREVAHLLRRTQAAALVTLAEHQGAPAPELVGALTADGVAVRHVVVPRFEGGPHDPITVDGAPVAPMEVDLAGRAMGPDDLFLVNSTSGTTGLPKCVAHTQNRWHHFHQRAAEHGALTASDVFLALVPTPFGFGLWTSHVTPAILGATTVVAERYDTARALDLAEANGATVVCCVSTQLAMLVADPRLTERHLRLRVMFTGGEAVPYERARAFEGATGCTILQFYGSNETGMLSGTRLGDPLHERVSTAGRVVPEMHVRLFDADGAEVAIPGEGRPAARGPATCLGYLDDPAANAELVRPDGWMLMGDVCSIDADGWLRVTGRVSDFIIRGGKNISAPQVEEEAMTHPAIALAAAVARPDDVFGERVCLYVELVEGATLTLDALVAHLAARGTGKELFPEHLVVLDALPRSSGGKVAKGDLRADAQRRAAEGQ